MKVFVCLISRNSRPDGKAFGEKTQSQEMSNIRWELNSPHEYSRIPHTLVGEPKYDFDDQLGAHRNYTGWQDQY